MRRMAYVFLLLWPLSAAAEVDCERHEQEGCLSLQGMTVVYDENLPEMAFVEERPNPGTRAYAEMVTNAGPDMYRLALEGKVQPAGYREFSIYMWNVDDTPTNRMKTFQLGKDPRKASSGHAREVEVSWVGRFDPEFAKANGLDDDPDRQFEVQSGGFAFSLMVPWSMIGEDTWIAICPWYGDAIYPDQRIENGEVIWLSPKKLKQMRDAGHEWVMTAYIYPEPSWIFDLLN